jgi:hypothetical protein
MKQREFSNKNVADTYQSYPKKIREKLLFIREMIFNIADETPNIGKIEETLKWGNPSYLTHSPKSGTTIRLAWLRSDAKKYAVSVHCQTTLVSEFKELHPELSYDGNRSIILDSQSEIPADTIRHFIISALNYHSRKKKGIGL